MDLPLEQQAIRAKCFHPSGRFVEFFLEDVALSIPARFERLRLLWSGVWFLPFHVNKGAALVQLQRCKDSQYAAHEE
jgi:hypothetical protein